MKSSPPTASYAHSEVSSSSSVTRSMGSPREESAHIASACTHQRANLRNGTVHSSPTAVIACVPGGTAIGRVVHSLWRGARLCLWAGLAFLSHAGRREAEAHPELARDRQAARPRRLVAAVGSGVGAVPELHQVHAVQDKPRAALLAGSGDERAPRPRPREARRRRRGG